MGLVGDQIRAILLFKITQKKDVIINFNKETIPDINHGCFFK